MSFYGKGDGTDPWEESYGTESPYLWKYDVGTEDLSPESNFLEPLKNFLKI